VSGIRIRIWALRNGGLSLGPFVRDTTTRHRFPPAVCLKASVLGLAVGEMTIANEDHFGRVLDLSVGRLWPKRLVARRLVREAESLGRQAEWTHLDWQLPGTGKGSLASWLAQPSSRTAEAE
jgi:hypothetical protein